MICAVSDAARTDRFLAALQGQDYPAVQLAAHWQAFGGLPGSGWQFYTGAETDPLFALSVKGTAAQCVGLCDPEEMGSFLGFLGVQQLAYRGPVPDGYRHAEPLCQFTLEAGGTLPECAPLPAGFTLEKQPPMGPVTELLMEAPELAAGGQDFYDEFYARGCALRNRGLARIWALYGPDGKIAATAGVYGIWQGRAYLTAVHTRSTLRRQGLGGWLVQALARQLASEGISTGLWCHSPRAQFYQNLGFAPGKAMPQIVAAWQE